MSYAQNYTPLSNFSQDESNSVSGRSSLKTASVDAEFANISTSINALNTNLKILQRSDGALNNSIVTMSSLSNTVKYALGNNPDSAELLDAACAEATAQAVIATEKAASIRVDAATFATIPTLTNPCFVFVAEDETNDNFPTVYFFDGANLQWLPSVEV